MFGDCNELKYLNLSNFKTSKVNNMDLMFADCHELQYLDLSNFNIKETYDTSYMFGNCNELTIVKGIENFDINHLNQEEINTEGMFEHCNKFKGYKELMLKLKNKQNFISEEDSNKLNDNLGNELEQNNPELLEGNNYSIVKPKEKDKMLIKCTYDIKENNFTQLINFRGKNSVNNDILNYLKVLNGDKKENLIFGRFFDNIGIHTITYICEIKFRNLSFMFRECSNQKKIEFITCDTSEVTNMEEMFVECKELEYLD